MKELIMRSYNNSISKGEIGFFSDKDSLIEDLQTKLDNAIYLYDKYNKIDNKIMVSKLVTIVEHIFNILIFHKRDPIEDFKNNVEYKESLLIKENNEKQESDRDNSIKIS